MQCTECGREFVPENSEEEICPQCQVADLPEAQMQYDVPYIGKVYYCTCCGRNEVDAAKGYDTCFDCLERQ